MRRAFLVLFLCFGFVYNFASASSVADPDSKKVAMDMMLAQAKDEPQIEPQLNEGFSEKSMTGDAVIKEAQEEEEDMPFGISDEVRFLPKTGANAMEGGVSFVENEFNADYEYKIMGKIPLEISVGSSYTSINNSTPVKLPAKLTSVGMGLNITFPLFFEKTFYRFGVEPSFNSDDWVIKGSTFRSPFSNIIIYQPNKKLTLGAGVTISPHYKFRNLVSPVYGFIYKPDDKWTFNMLSEKPQVTYQFNKKLILLFEVGFTNEEYLVSKDNVKEIIIRQFDNRYGFGARYKVNKNIELSAVIGGVIDRTLKYRDELGKVASKPGMYTQFRVDIGI